MPGCDRSSGSRCPLLVMTNTRSSDGPNASRAPRAMEQAALPTAAAQTGPSWRVACAASSTSRTQRRPSTHSSPAWSSPRRSARRPSAEVISGSADDLERPPVAAQLLRLVRALELQPLEVFRRDIARDVLAGEAGRVEFLDARILVLAGGDEVLEVLIDEPIGADELRDLIEPPSARDELAGRRHVDAVDVGEAYRRRSRGEIHLAGARLARELDDLRGGRAAHDGVIHQQHVLAAELEVDGVQLPAHRLLPLLLAGHDEGTADVAVLDEAFPVLDAEALCELQGTRAARVRDRNDNVDV